MPLPLSSQLSYTMQLIYLFHCAHHGFYNSHRPLTHATRTVHHQHLRGGVLHHHRVGPFAHLASDVVVCQSLKPTHVLLRYLLHLPVLHFPAFHNFVTCCLPSLSSANFTVMPNSAITKSLKCSFGRFKDSQNSSNFNQ